MSIFNGMSKRKFRIQVSIICTILFAGSWCLSQTPGNLFWLSISRGTYFKHIGIWISIGLLVFVTLHLINRRWAYIENRVILFIFILSTLNILDYGVRSIFGAVSKWPNAILAGWSMITLLLPALAIFLVLKIRVSRKVLEKAIKVCLLPSVLFIYYSVPSEFTILKVEKPLRNGDRPPIHFILFDMLSYDLISINNEILPNYNNFKSFSNVADVYLNAYSPSSTTGQTIPRLLTGNDFEKVGHNFNIWTVQTKNSLKMQIISSYETIFSLADEAGYDVFLRAFALPYLNNFYDHIQSGEVYPFDTLWRGGMHSLIWPTLFPGGIQHQMTTNSILDDYLTRVLKNPRNTFFYTHWNIPHDPFIYDSNGQMMNRFELTKQLISRPDRKLRYRQQLTGTDRILGQLIQAIKDSGTYEKSLIIITSDHNIKGFGFDLKRIPLMIKWPYQKESKKVFSIVTSTDIFRYFKNFIQSQK